MSASRLSICITAATLAGCGPAQAPRAPQGPLKPAVEIAPPDLASGPSGEYLSDRYNLRLPLPSAPSWKIEDARSPWLEATHAAASALLLVRVWREADITNRARCEEQARLQRRLPERERAEIIEHRRLSVPRGFDTMVDVGVLRVERDQPITGFVMAFGGWAHRCFAYVLTTSASGKDAEQLIAGRLATMVELSLSSVTLEGELNPSLPREPGP